MRKADLRRNHEPFDAALGRYRSFAGKVLGAQRVIRTLTEKEDLVESVVLRICAHWERFVDEHLVDCVNCNPSKLSQFLGVSMPRHPSRNVCEAVLFGGGYRDFRSFGDLKGFTKKVLPDTSNPFLAIGKSRGEKIDEVYKIRNYLAHYSGVARRSLRHMYSTKYNITRFVEPGRFLRGYNARRLWAYFDAFEGASSDMKGWY